MFNRLHDAVSETTQRFDGELTDQIQQLEAQLKELREEQTRNKGRQQRQLSLVGALQSALGQVVRAVHATQKAGEEELLDAFWLEIEAVQNGEYGEIDLAQLPKPSEPDGDAGTQENSPTPNGNGVLDVEVVNGKPERQNLDNMTLNQLKDAVLEVIGRDQVYRYGRLNLRETWEKAYRDLFEAGLPGSGMKNIKQ
ncbi:MAG: hypothetical protein SWJ54_22440 [Cyanobacteriota bacterium]|nr:hypothetical protein [Cyanobacteriota bacterium]